jgi:hypothetical protein
MGVFNKFIKFLAYRFYLSPRLFTIMVLLSAIMTFVLGDFMSSLMASMHLVVLQAVMFAMTRMLKAAQLSNLQFMISRLDYKMRKWE